MKPIALIVVCMISSCTFPVSQKAHGSTPPPESEAMDLNAPHFERTGRCLEFWGDAFDEWYKHVRPIELSIVKLQSRISEDQSHWISELIVSTWTKIPDSLNTLTEWGSIEPSEELRYLTIHSFGSRASNFMKSDCTEWFWFEGYIWLTLAMSHSNVDGVQMPIEASKDIVWESPHAPRWFLTWLLTPHPNLRISEK